MDVPWIGPIVATHREVRRTQVRLLADAGWTQAAIGKAVGLGRVTVTDILSEMADSPFPTSPDLVSAAVDRLDGDAHDAAAEVARRAQSAQAFLRGKSLGDRSALCRRWPWGGPGGHPPWVSAPGGVGNPYTVRGAHPGDRGAGAARGGTPGGAGGSPDPYTARWAGLPGLGAPRGGGSPPRGGGAAWPCTGWARRRRAVGAGAISRHRQLSGAWLTRTKKRVSRSQWVPTV